MVNESAGEVVVVQLVSSESLTPLTSYPHCFILLPIYFTGRTNCRFHTLPVPAQMKF